MGILERLTRPARSPRERFADQVLAELRRIGFTDAEFRPTQFAIVCECGQDAYSTLFLSKAFSQYQRSHGDRKQFVREFVAHSLAPPVQPATFAEALPELRLALRHAARGTRTLRRPALPHLDEVVLVGDVPLDIDSPARWRVSPEEIFAAAHHRTLARAELPASAGFFGPSVLHVPDYGGEQLVSWVLLEGWLAELDEQVGGRAVAFLPSTLMLLVCTDEPRLVEQLYELAADEYARTPRPLSPMAYTTDDDGRVVPFLPDRGHPAYPAASRAARRLAVDVAEHQRRTLGHQQAPGQPRLVEATLAARPDGSAFTSAQWTVGTPALLPAVDLVGVSVPGEKVFHVPWALLVEADLLIEEVDYRPSRFSVEPAPSAASLGYLRERAVRW
ncbi:hypothetical protein Dvina_47670 [Dactylosporangium vinaceum]|uniref:Uncharacterized protein n=1 Tax=Dactylosporangium vinaceum TaxID=53362 RepID=A0ABV5M5R1_9ACTN|nr:hypothetical protein [Dactylosporangium vinaceum]UAB95606.1 hypothetical protein Dvina_47670 [Dactylosporangium vinaceum]